MADCTPTLNSLPVEILQLIVAPLARKDIKALRWTNRKICSVASEAMFESITITTNQASYAQLLNVAGSEFWSKQVGHVDWVIFYGASDWKWDNLAQEIIFNAPWPNTLRKWGIMSGRGRPHYGLGLQCQLIKRMQNVRTVRFWPVSPEQQDARGGDSWEYHEGEPRDYPGGEPWDYRSTVVFEGQYGSANHEPIKSIKMRPITSKHDPRPDDVFSILRLANLEPRLVKTAEAELRLGFSGIKHFTSIEILSNEPYSKPQLYCSHHHLMERTIRNFDLNCLKSLAKSKINNVKSLKISGVLVSLDDMKKILTASNKLRTLHVGNIELTDPVHDEPMVQFLQHLRHIYNKDRLHKLRVTFQETRCEWLIGEFTANEKQMQAWMEESDDELQKTASSAFRQDEGYLYSDISDSDDVVYDSFYDSEDLDDLEHMEEMNFLEDMFPEFFDPGTL